MIENAGLRGTDTVIEIGTGRGELTECMAPHVQRIFSYEKDEDLFLEARKRMNHLRNVTLVQGDAFESLGGERNGMAFDVCITSLPYSRSLDFVRWLALRSGTFRTSVALLQTDFVQKLLASEGAANYRAVSVIAQIAFRLKEISHVNRYDFAPPPRVGSCIVRFESNDNLRQPFFDLKKMQVIKQLFSFRGRLLRNALKHAAIRESGLLSSIREDLWQKRIESIKPSEFASIIESLFP